MNGDVAPENEFGTPDKWNSSERPIDSVLLNALIEITNENANDIILDESSIDILKDALLAVTTEDDRQSFDDSATLIRSGKAINESSRMNIASVVDAVRQELGDRYVQVEVDHQATISLGQYEAAIYTFVQTRDPTVLSEARFPTTVAELIEAGANLVAEEKFEQAAIVFEQAVDATKGGDGSVAARSLAAWANHWAGDDQMAIDFVEEALHLHMDAWTPTLAGYSADPDTSFARSNQFRDGKYAAMALLRYTVDLPETTTITPSLGLMGEDGTIKRWLPLEGSDKCIPLPRLTPKTILRLQLRGQIPAFPAVHSYYVASGIVDSTVNEVREVYRLLLDGPAGQTVSETIRFKIDG